MNTMNISIVRDKRKAKISGDTLYLGDSSIFVSVSGINPNESAKFAPCLRLLKPYNKEVCAECKLIQDGENLTGTLSLNTIQMHMVFEGLPLQASREFAVLVSSETNRCLIASGRCRVNNFVACGLNTPEDVTAVREDEVSKLTDILSRMDIVEDSLRIALSPLIKETYSVTTLRDIVSALTDVIRKLGGKVV